MPARSVTRSNQNGSISILMVISIAALAGLLLLVVNTGAHTSKKIELQNTTDAAVYSGAVWISRGLNVISMDNVIQANLLAVAFAIPSFSDALGVAIEILTIEIAACHAAAAATFGVVEIVCTFLEIEQQALIQVKDDVVDPILVPPTRPPDGLFWQVMRGLGQESVVVKDIVPSTAEAEVYRLATDDQRAELALIVSRGEGGGLTLLPTIPAQVGTFQDLCDATRRPLYPSDQSPLDHAIDAISDNILVDIVNLTTDVKGIFRAFVNARYAQYCGGPPMPTTIPQPVKTLEECRAGNGEATWQATTYNDPVRPTFDAASADITGPVGEESKFRSFTQRCTWTPPGSRVSGDSRVYQTGYVEKGGTSDAPTYHAVVTIYRATGLSVRGSAAPSGPSPPPVTPDGDWRPKPVVLTDDGGDLSTEGARARLEYLVLTMSNPTWRLGGTPWDSPLGDTTYAYGQARSFNPTTFDLFTQNWRAKLVPASALENGMMSEGIDASTNPLRDPGPLGILQNLQSLIALLNNH